MNKTRLLALARKALDEASTDHERNTSGQMLAKEIVRLLTETERVAEPILNVAEQEAAQRATSTVQAAVVRDEIKNRPVKDSLRSEVAWVEFDPPVSSPFASNAFGRKPRSPPR